MLIIQIALGIVLAVVILLFWKQLTRLAFKAAILLAILAVLVICGVWLSGNWGPQLGHILVSAIIGGLCGVMIGEPLHTFLQNRKIDRGISENAVVISITILSFIFWYFVTSSIKF